MKRNLHRQVKGILDEKSDKLDLISGSLGITIGGQKTVEVSSREGYVWVRLRGSQSELIQAYNAVVSPIFDLPVLVIRQGNKYSVYGRDIQRYENWGVTPYLPKHGTQHSFSPDSGMGGDVTWVYSRQFVPMLVAPSGTAGAGQVIINSFVYRNPTNGSWLHIGDAGSDNLLVAKPLDNQARMLLLYWDLSANDSGILTGTSFTASTTGTSAVLPYIPSLADSNKIPLAGIRLVSGTTAIGWDNIYDIRQFAVNTPAPSEGGTFSIWDEGTPLGTGTTLNFMGAGVEASLSGSVAFINVTATGGGGGDSLWTTGSAGSFSITTKDGSNVSTGDRSLSHGVNTRAFGANSHSEGSASVATGSASHAEGTSTVARGIGSHAEGNSTLALGTHSHAEGISTIASGSYSHAEGEESIALGWASHAAGGFNIARGNYSAIIAGQSNYVSGLNSSVLAGTGLTGSANNTAYTDMFNLKRLNTGTAIANVGINAQGFLVTGTAGGSVNWGSIGGTLSSQTDLQSALDAKAAASVLNSHISGTTGVHAASAISIVDSGGYYTGTANVEIALQEVGAKNQLLIFGGHGNGGTVPAGTTYYIVPMIAGLDTVGRSYPIPIAGTLKNLYFRLATAQPGTGSLVIEIYGGASALTATGIQITIPAGSAAATFSNTTNTFSHAAGDLVAVRITNNASGASGVVGGVSFGLQSSLF